MTEDEEWEMIFLLIDNKISWLNSKYINDRIDASSYIQQIRVGLFDLLKQEHENFIIKTLYDICETIVDGPFGSTILESDYVNEGIPFIRVQNVTEHGLDTSNLIFVNEYANNRINRSECKAGDLVITKTGRLGSTCVLNNEYKKYNIRGDLAKLGLKKNIDPYFIMTYLNSNVGIKITNSYSSGSTRGRILLSNIKKISIPIPSPEIQKYIGDKVRKSEELREEAKRLKKEAERILFKELDLENLNSILNFYNNKHIWIEDEKLNDRIDATFYNPKVQKIKEFYQKYKMIKLKSIVDYKKGYAFKSKDYIRDGTALLFRVSDIGNDNINYDNMIKLSNEIYNLHKEFELENDDIIMVVTGNTAGKSVIINNKKDIILLNQNAIRIRVKTDKIKPYYIEFILKSEYFQKLLKYSLFQSVQPFISMEFLNNIEIPVINEEIIEKISTMYKSSMDNLCVAKQLIKQAKQDIEDLIEDNFDISKIKEVNKN